MRGLLGLIGWYVAWMLVVIGVLELIVWRWWDPDTTVVFLVSLAAGGFVPQLAMIVPMLCEWRWFERLMDV